MADEHHVGLVVLMRRQPLAKVLGTDLHGMVRLVPRVNLGVDDMGVGQRILEVGVHVRGKRAEGLLVAVEAVDVDEEKAAAGVMGEGLGVRFRGDQGLGGRRAGVGGPEVGAGGKEGIVACGLHGDMVVGVPTGRQAKRVTAMAGFGSLRARADLVRQSCWK